MSASSASPWNSTPKLLISAIEERAKWTPNNTYMRYPSAEWETKGYEAMSWRQYVNAIDKVAYWLDERLGPASTSDIIAYFGPNDPRYAIIVPAAIKTGRKLFVPDGRMTPERLSGLLTSTDCKFWIYAEDDTNRLSIVEDMQLGLCGLPSLEWMLDNGGQVRYAYDKTFPQAADDITVIIHSSGTTGVPKAIHHTNAMWSAMGNTAELNQRLWPRGLSYESWIGRTALNCCAPQWFAGLHGMILGPVFMDSPCIMLPPDVASPTPKVFKKIMKMNLMEGIKSPPHTIVTLYEDVESREMLKSLRFITYVGAALNQSIGDDLCQYTRVTPIIGSTEIGGYQSLRALDRKLWYTHDFIPEQGGRMIPVDSKDGDGSDLYELVFDKPSIGSETVYHSAFRTPHFMGLSCFETNDLYTSVDDLDGRKRWAFSTRKDDLTKLSWLAKFHAQNIESRVQQHPDIKSVVVGGQGRSAPYVIIEMREGVVDPGGEVRLLNDLYATVIADANAVAIEEVRIPKETVMLATKDKPLKHNLKQVVMRREVETDYGEEIEQAYARLDASTISS